MHKFFSVTEFLENADSVYKFKKLEVYDLTLSMLPAFTIDLVEV